MCLQLIKLHILFLSYENIIKYQTPLIKGCMNYAKLITQKRNFCKVIHSIIFAICGTGLKTYSLWLYHNFNSTIPPFLTDVVLPALSSLPTTYGLVALPYLTPIAEFTSCNYGHLALTCSIPVFYRRTSERFLIWSSGANKTLNFRTPTNIIAC